MGNRPSLFCALAVIATAVLVPAQTAPPAGPQSGANDGVRASAMPYRDAKPIIDVLRQELLPEEFAGAARTADEAASWSEWTRRHDLDIRARVARGDEDSVLNLLLFGTTFTRLPRLTERDIADMADGGAAPVVVGQRSAALTAALAAPGGDERLRFAADVAARQVIDAGASVSQSALRRWLDDGLSRLVAEYRRHAVAAHDPTTGASGSSTLYSDRGLASDTTLFPGFGLEQTLDALKSKALLEPGSVRRVAVVGPGLDFADKREGYDFYPPQTLQPFAVVDSLRRLGLAASEGPQVTTLDLSARVNGHLEAARARARAGTGYEIQLPRADGPVQWTPFLIDYWNRFGDRIGEGVTPMAPGLPGVQNRAIRVRPAIVDAIVPHELNIVLERLDTGASARFDLVIATNVLIYYEVFDQLLAVENAAAMLRPGGFLLTNTPVPLVASSPVELLGYTEVGYTDRPEGDRFFWYRKTE